MKRLAAILLILTLLVGTLCLSACEQLKEALMHLDDNTSDHAESGAVSTSENLEQSSGGAEESAGDPSSEDAGVTSSVPESSETGSSVQPSESSADDPVPLVASGKIENFNWALDAEGKLVFSGQGEMPFIDNEDYWKNLEMFKDLPPTGGAEWINSKLKGLDGKFDKVTTVVISEGITHLLSFHVETWADATRIPFDYNMFQGFPNLKHVVLPSTLENIDGAFQGCGSLESVVIPNGVKTIAANTFSECKSLKNVDIPDSVTQMGYGVFDGCTSLESVSIGKGLSKIESGYESGWYNGHGLSVFADCPSLKSIDISPENTTYCFEGNCLINKETGSVVFGFSDAQIPSYVKAIGASAFENSDITSIHLPDGLVGISDNAFSGCSSLSAITFPDGISCIGKSAFKDCTALKDIVVPDSVTELRDFAFDGCTSLESAKLGNGVKELSEGLFCDCSSLKSVVLPSDITSIWGAESGGAPSYSSMTPAFRGCESLETIVIPDGVTYIGCGAFSGCTSLKDITLPSNVEYIGHHAFEDTPFYADQKNWENGVLYMGIYLIRASENLSGDYKIKDGTKLIADGAFLNCNSLISVVIPESVTYRFLAFPGGITSQLFNFKLDTLTVKSLVVANELQEGRGVFGGYYNSFELYPNTLIFGEGIEATPYVQENYTYAGTKTEDGETLSVYNKKS